MHWVTHWVTPLAPIVNFGIVCSSISICVPQIWCFTKIEIRHPKKRIMNKYKDWNIKIINNNDFILGSLFELSASAELIPEWKIDGVNDTMLLLLFELVFLFILLVTLQIRCISWARVVPSQKPSKLIQNWTQHIAK